MTAPFVVFSLPRSRSAWLSRFLSYGDWICGHDQIQYCQSLADISTWFTQPNIGTVETSAAPFWRMLVREQPHARIAVVRRPVPDVLAALAKQGVGGETVEAMISACDRKLDQIERRVPGVLSVRFDDLEREDVCATLFEHCLGQPMDPAWWATWDAQHVSGDLKAQTRYCQAYLPRFLKLARSARQRILIDMARPVKNLDGLTFQVEPFRQAYRDAEPLMREHMIQTGQAPDDHTRKNLPLFELLDELGKLHIFTSRVNGRMFSYLVSIIGPSLDSLNELVAEQTAFFADPSFPGLGMRTQKAAIEDLRSRGVHRVIMRAGHRGSGPRLGSMFQRLGAEPIGALYNLPLVAASSAA